MNKHLMVCALAFLFVLESAMSSSRRSGIHSATTLEHRIKEVNDELFHKGNLEMIEEVFAPNYIVHSDGEDVEGGPDLIKDFVMDLRAAFPDLHVEVEVLMEHGDRAAWQRTHHGTFKADFRGIAASGRKETWQTIVVSRYEGDKLAEEWAVSNFVGIFQRP